MTSRDITAIALRLFSLWLLVQVVLNIPSLALLLISLEHYQGQATPEHVHVFLVGGFMAIGILAAFLLWLAAKSALARCYNTDTRNVDQQGQMFLLQLGGCYFVVTALANLPRSLAFLANSLELSLANYLWPVGLLFQLCIGLALLVRASKWVKLLAKLRGRA